jgi:hypothetical protein
MGPFEVRGPRSGFEWTTAIPRIDASAVGVAVVRAWGKAEDALLIVFYRVADPARLLEFYVPKVSLEEGIDRALREAGHA